MLFPIPVAHYVCKAVRWADRQIRSELINGYIATENDYTSNLTGMIRRQINGYDVTGLSAVSFVLKPGLERKAGADACLILANKTGFKVGLFEAKWPRLTTHTNYWDSLRKSSGISHFDSQLARQHKHVGTFAIWEIFYLEHPFKTQPVAFPNHNSACVWHSVAHAASSVRNQSLPWTDSELLALSPVLTIEDIVAKMCACKAGTLIPGTDYARAFDNMVDPPSRALVIKYTGDNDEAEDI